MFQLRSLRVVVLALGTAFAGCSSCRRPPPALDGATSTGTPTPPELRAALREAARAKGPNDVARTRHRAPDGSPKYTNRLIFESSPYLLQHAHNPVDWFAWSDEAFETARRLGRPVFLSVGYSTCHWCHVMEEESFEDEEIAAYLNANYIAVKVDREERPDVDAIYMSAVQAMTGSGGWPMTVWLTPERKPFFCGTYFPARDGERQTQAGLFSTLKKFKRAYDDDPKSVADSAAELTHAVQRASGGGSTESPSSTSAQSILDGAAAEYARRFDDLNGGIRGAPKFPSALPVRLLLRDHRRNPTGGALKSAVVTLEHMAGGGIHDHIGGGFHRYSTDEQWLVPHFEKMLYDNAQLARAYLEAYQVTRREDFAAITREIFAYVEREMTSPDGAFYSASDADSLTPAGKREEGWFFTWTPAELENALGARHARIVEAYYGVTHAGNLEGRSILSARVPIPDVAKHLSMPVPALRATLDSARETLLRERAKRPLPLRDEKILTAWNGLMISAHARAALTLGDPKLAERAERATEFVLRALQKDGRLLRTYKDGQAKNAACLDDYAFMIAALLDLHEATGRLRWLEEAIRLDRVLEVHYEDKTVGGFFLTSDDHEKLLARDKPTHDGAEPSGNAVALLNLLRLHALTTKDTYRARADRALAGFGGALATAPTSASEMLIGLDFLVDVPMEIVVVTPTSRAEAEPFLAKLRGVFLPNSVLVVVAEGAELAAFEKVVPLVSAKVAKGGKATAYVCEKRTCALPTADPEVFSRLLRKPAKP